MATAKLRDPDSDDPQAVPDAGESDEITVDAFLDYLREQGVGERYDPNTMICSKDLMKKMDLSEGIARSVIEKQVREGRLVDVGRVFDDSRGRYVRAWRIVRVNDGREDSKDVAGGKKGAG